MEIHGEIEKDEAADGETEPRYRATSTDKKFEEVLATTPLVYSHSDLRAILHWRTNTPQLQA